MPESPPELPSAGALNQARAEFRAAWFGGMIEGVRGSDAALKQAVAQLNQLQLARVELELDARQFSALIDDRPLETQDWKSERLDEFVQGLQALVSASESPALVESNMRCVELYGDRVVETLFAVIQGQVHCNSQVRSPRPSDEELLARYAAPLDVKHMGLGKKLMLSLVTLLITLLVGAQMGLGNLFFPRPAEELLLETGAFEELLNLEVESVFGGYQVTLQRGPDYSQASQTTEASLNALSQSLAAKAALLTVGTGNEVFVRVFDHEGILLAVGAVYLESLLGQADATVNLTLPAFRTAERLELSLIRGTPGS